LESNYIKTLQLESRTKLEIIALPKKGSSVSTVPTELGAVQVTMLVPGSSLINCRRGEEERCLTIQRITLSLHCHIYNIKEEYGLPKSRLL